MKGSFGTVIDDDNRDFFGLVFNYFTSVLPLTASLCCFQK